MGRARGIVNVVAARICMCWPFHMVQDLLRGICLAYGLVRLLNYVMSIKELIFNENKESTNIKKRCRKLKFHRYR